MCNWTVIFYSLPELSPVFGQVQIRPCNWIGGIDLNTDPKEGPAVVVLASLNKKIRVIKIGEEPRALRVTIVIFVTLLQQVLTLPSPLILREVRLRSDVIPLPV